MDTRTARFGLRVLSDKVRARPTPYIVQLTLLNQCNYQCEYCYAEYYKRGGKRMPLDQVKHVIDELAKVGSFRLNLVGGEPLLRKDIGEIVEYGNRAGLMMVMTTNGYFVRQYMDVIKQLHSVCISLDGDAEHNDKNRGEGTFPQIMDGVEACREAGMPVNFSSVLTRHTWDQVDFMVGMARKYRGFVDFTTLISQEREGNGANDSIAPSGEEVRAALRRIVDLRNNGAPIGFTAAAYEHALNWPDYSVPFITKVNPEFNKVKCFAGRYYIFVDYNGDIYPCPQQVGIMKHGNIFTDGFAEAHRIAAEHDCYACPQTCTTDLSMFFGMKPEALVGKLRHARGAGR